MKKEEEEKIKRQSNTKFVITILALLILVVMVIGISMATFTFVREGEEINTINSGNIFLDYIEDTNGINITNAYPMSDENGKKLSNENQYFDFSVRAIINGDAIINYEVAAQKKGTSTLNDNEVKLYLEKKTSNGFEQVMAPKNFTPLTNDSDMNTPKGSMILVRDSFTKTTTENYRLRMWVSENAEITEIPRTYAVQVSVNAKVEVK